MGGSLCPLRVAWRQSCRELQLEHRQIRQSQAEGGPSYRHFERLDPGLELLDRGALSVLELLEGRLCAKLVPCGDRACNGERQQSAADQEGSESGRPSNPRLRFPSPRPAGRLTAIPGVGSGIRRHPVRGPAAIS